MKVIFITREGYDLAGARIRCYNFAKELNRYGLETEVLSFADTLGAKSGKEESKLRVREKLRYNNIAFQRFKKEKNVIFFLNRFHYHSFAPWLLSVLNGNKLIFDMDDWEMRESPKYYFGVWPTSKAAFLTNRIAKHAWFCIGASKFLADYLSEFNKNTYYIPSGVDTEKFKPTNVKKDNSKIIFSWIGTMHRKSDIENIEFIIDCFLRVNQKNSNISLEIVGDGIYRNLLKEGQLENKNIIFKGWIQPDNVPHYLNQIDIGLVPLIQNTKFNKAKSPVKLFEYMAMGKPTISSDIGEVNETIKDGKQGLLAKDKAEFINKMNMLITDPRLRKELGKEAMKIIKNNYTLRILAQKIYEILIHRA